MIVEQERKIGPGVTMLAVLILILMALVFALTFLDSDISIATGILIFLIRRIL